MICGGGSVGVTAGGGAVARTGGGVRRGAGGGGPAFAGKLSGKPSTCGIPESSSTCGASGISGTTLATLGRTTGGGGTNTRAAVFFWNKHDVVPNDIARINGSCRNLDMMNQHRKLQAESSSPADLAGKVDSTIM
jgi:hypothetical protein